MPDRYRFLSNASDEAMLFCRDDRIVDANEAATRLLGTPHDELVDQPLHAHLTLYRNGLPGHSSLAMARCNDGGGVPVALLADREIVYLDGQRAELLAFRNLAELGTGDERLRQALAEQQAILDGLQVGVGYFVNRSVVWINRRWEAMFQRDMEQVRRLGTSVYFRTREEWVEFGRCDYPAMARGEEVSDDLEFRRKDGSLFWCRVRGMAVNKADPLQGSVWIYEDVTDKRRSEENMRLALTVMENSLDAIFITDPALRVMRVNPSFSQMLGWRDDDVVGHRTFFLKSGQRDEAFYRHELSRLLEHGSWKGEHWARMRSGEELPVMLSLSVVRRPDGQISHVSGVLSDISERKRYEAHLEQINEELEQRVEQRTAELRSMVAGLESFNSSISHDLRGPLGGIVGLSRLAAEALARGDPHTVSRMLSAMTTQAETSGRLVTALLALARMGDSDLARQPVSLDALVREVLESLRCVDPGGRPLPVRLTPLPVVDADPDLLRQVYVNLLANALKFTRQADAPLIAVGAFDSDDETVLYVRDNGVGFDATQASQLFTAFKRLHGVEFQGHGVGLSIVKRIVERHGGRIWAESEPASGATFFFTLAPRPSP